MTTYSGDLSLASYSLAPSSHSYHAVGDFDVDKKNFGEKYFTGEFALTYDFKRLLNLGYLNIRYPQNNPYGVRYEPWHIKCSMILINYSGKPRAKFVAKKSMLASCNPDF
ncbi:MAG: hypothetical protein V3T45_00650 [Nitrospinaceae bacterium]